MVCHAALLVLTLRLPSPAREGGCAAGGGADGHRWWRAARRLRLALPVRLARPAGAEQPQRRYSMPPSCSGEEGQEMPTNALAMRPCASHFTRSGRYAILCQRVSGEKAWDASLVQHRKNGAHVGGAVERYGRIRPSHLPMRRRFDDIGWRRGTGSAVPLSSIRRTLAAGSSASAGQAIASRCTSMWVVKARRTRSHPWCMGMRWWHGVYGKPSGDVTARKRVRST